MEWLQKQETDHPVETWRYGNWHVWPYLRVNLAIRARYGRTEKHSSVVARMSQPLRVFKRLLRMAGSRRGAANSGGTEDTQRYPVVALTHARRPVVVDGQVVSPFVGVLMNWLRAWQIPAISIEAYCEPDLRRIPRPYNYRLWEDMQPKMHLPLMKERLPWAGAFRNMERELGVEPAFLQRLQVIEQRARFWEDYFRSHGTALLLVTCWYDAPVVMPAVLAARQLGIPAVDIQHGFQDRYHEAYGGWTKAPPQGYELMPDFFWCWSRDRCRESEDVNPGLRNAVRYFAGGDLWLNHNTHALAHADRPLYERAARHCSPFARTILVCPCGNSLQHGVYPRLKSAIDSSPGNWNWMIRLHPRDRSRQREIEALLGAAGLRQRLDLDFSNALSLYECISLCDVMVSDLSTCAQEGLAFGKPCVIIDSNGRDAYARPIAEGSMIYAEGEGIADALSRAMSIAPDVCRRSAEYFFAPHEQSHRAVAEFLRCTLGLPLAELDTALSCR